MPHESCPNPGEMLATPICAGLMQHNFLYFVFIKNIFSSLFSVDVIKDYSDKSKLEERRFIFKVHSFRFQTIIAKKPQWQELKTTAALTIRKQ